MNPSTIEPAQVAEHLGLLFDGKPFFRSATVAYDDAGAHVEVRVNRGHLPEDGLHVGCLGGVRVCLLVCG